MSKLAHPDLHHFSAAIGWLELGNSAEAKIELRKINPSQQAEPDVLEIEWAIHAADRHWTEALQSARKLIEADPNRPTGWLHQAYALRRVAEGGLAAAFDALMPAAEKFPAEPTIPYNLACYTCQMQQLEEARNWLRRAWQCHSGKKEDLKKMALADDDLRALWKEIPSL